MRQPYPYSGDPPVGHCPLTLFRDLGPGFENKVMSYHMNWKNGVMPEPGGLLDQASCYPEAMLAVEAGISAAQNLKQELAQRDQERKARQSGNTGKPRHTGARVRKGRAK